MKGIWQTSLVSAAMVAMLSVVTSAQERQPPSTMISVEGMHCAGCAKKIETAIKGIPGVVAVRADAQAKSVTVSPVPNRVVSPRALWEAVEKAGYQPTKMVGPGGVFKEKPKA